MGDGEFSEVELAQHVGAVTFHKQFVYQRLGNYTVVARATSQREEEIVTTYAKVLTLARIIVTVG